MATFFYNASKNCHPFWYFNSGPYDKKQIGFFIMKTTPSSLISCGKQASMMYFVTTPIYNDFFLFDCGY